MEGQLYGNTDHLDEPVPGGSSPLQSILNEISHSESEEDDINMVNLEKEMELDEDEAREEANKAEDFKKLQEEVAAAKPKGTVRAGPPQIER